MNCSLFLRNVVATCINRLQKLQNRAVRIITNSGFDAPAKSFLANLVLRSRMELFENELQFMVLKSVNDFASYYLRKFVI